MKLFLWYRLISLADHLDGQAVAHANTKQQAIKEVLKSIINNMNDHVQLYPHDADYERRYFTAIMKAVAKELHNTEPKVIEENQPIGIEIYGSA